MSPYKRIPFQFSLHTLRDAESEPEHVEFLHLERSDPTRAVAELLDKHIRRINGIVDRIFSIHFPDQRCRQVRSSHLYVRFDDSFAILCSKIRTLG